MTPSEKLQLPIIGKIRCQLVGSINQKSFKCGEDEYEVLKILNQDDKHRMAYMVNVWNDEHNEEPLFVSAMLVLHYEEL